jgi:hypothetical protein
VLKGVNPHFLHTRTRLQASKICFVPCSYFLKLNFLLQFLQTIFIFIFLIIFLNSEILKSCRKKVTYFYFIYILFTIWKLLFWGKISGFQTLFLLLFFTTILPLFYGIDILLFLLIKQPHPCQIRNSHSNFHLSLTYLPNVCQCQISFKKFVLIYLSKSNCIFFFFGTGTQNKIERQE